MDTSETYIRMCDCPEIQDRWEPLWLAFVMHELQGKKWNGEEWKEE